MAKHYGTPCGTVHELENSEQPKCRQRMAKRQTNWTTIAVAVGSMYRYLIRIQGCSRTLHIVFRCFDFNLLHFYVHLCLTSITQPVATPTAGGMAGMGSGSKFLEAKLGLEATWSKRRYSNFLCPVTPSVFETTA